MLQFCLKSPPAETQYAAKFDPIAIDDQLAKIRPNANFTNPSLAPPPQKKALIKRKCLRTFCFHLENNQPFMLQANAHIQLFNSLFLLLLKNANGISMEICKFMRACNAHSTSPQQTHTNTDTNTNIRNVWSSYIQMPYLRPDCVFVCAEYIIGLLIR